MYLCKCIHFSILCCCYAAIFGTCFAVLNYINSLIHWLTEVAEASILAQLSATESRILNTQHRTAQNLFCNGLRHKPNILTLNKIWLGYLVDGLKHCPEVNVELSRPWKRYLKSDHCHLISQFSVHWGEPCRSPEFSAAYSSSSSTSITSVDFARFVSGFVFFLLGILLLIMKELFS